MLDSILSTIHTATGTGDFSWEPDVKRILQESEEKLGRIDSQISDLVTLRDRERSVVATLRGLLSPIRHLPVELLVEIFMFAIHSTAYNKESVTDILAICQVCAYWRRIAHSSPRLWTKALVMHTKTQYSVTDLAAMAGWLKRSAPLPIPIILKHDRHEVPTPLIDMVLEISCRWRSLCIETSDLSLAQLGRIASLDSLEEVDLTSTVDEGYRHHPVITAFLDAPCLRNVALDVPLLHLFPMPWTQIAHLDILNDSPQVCLDILSQCHNAVFVRLVMCKWARPPQLATISILPFLETLDLEINGYRNGSHFMPFFNSLALPGLKKLQLWIDEAADWSIASFTQFQLRSPNIEALKLEFCPPSSRDLVAILENAPLLTELVLTYAHDCLDDYSLNALAYSATDSVHLVPRLQVLSFQNTGDNFGERALEDMLLSRWWSDDELEALASRPPVTRWKSVEFWRDDSFPYPYDEFSPEFQRTMVNCQSEGLELSVE
ncbi:hypothetical protein DFH09DRAFT_1039240 [Mycena vulgaris]|nr:hypothetical protein DFH09DRAFT_1039240 [Mycena vulgaris]